MTSWKGNKVIGMVAAIIFVVSIVTIMLYNIRTSSERQKILRKPNPPAVTQ